MEAAAAARAVAATAAAGVTLSESLLKIVAQAEQARPVLIELTDRFLVQSFLPLQRERIESLQTQIRDVVERLRQAEPAWGAPLAPTEKLRKMKRAAKPERVRRSRERDTLGDTRDLEGELDCLLSKYADAIRNYETLSQEAMPSPWAQSEPQIVMEKTLAGLGIKKFKHRRKIRKSAQRLLEGLDWANISGSFRELNRDFRIKQQRREAFMERLWMGAFGGAAVIGPMILMVLKPDRNTILVTVSVATGLFIFTLAYWAQGLGGKDVLAATAAYAAVLVVFVGTNMAPVSSSNAGDS